MPFAPFLLAQAVRLNKATAPISRSAPRRIVPLISVVLILFMVFLPRHELQFQWSLLRPKNLDFRYMLQCSRKRALFIAEFVAEAISKGATLHIDGHPDYHLLEIGSVILIVTALADLTTLAFEVERSGVEED